MYYYVPPHWSFGFGAYRVRGGMVCFDGMPAFTAHV